VITSITDVAPDTSPVENTTKEQDPKFESVYKHFEDYPGASRELVSDIYKSYRKREDFDSLSEEVLVEALNTDIGLCQIDRHLNHIRKLNKQGEENGVPLGQAFEDKLFATKEIDGKQVPLVESEDILRAMSGEKDAVAKVAEAVGQDKTTDYLINEYTDIVSFRNNLEKVFEFVPYKESGISPTEMVQNLKVFLELIKRSRLFAQFAGFSTQIEIIIDKLTSAGSESGLSPREIIFVKWATTQARISQSEDASEISLN
jgi:hypothetical protein